jgi:PKD repeat protein
VHLVGGQSSDPANRPLTGTWTLTRAPAASTLTLPNSGDLNVGPLTLDAPGTYEMSLVVTNDLGLTSPACAVTVQASADAPVAVCSASPPVVAAIHETFRLLGSSSYDPSGRPITGATWTLTGRPPGSALVLPAGSGPDTAPLSADVVGTYTAELVVTNDLGVASAPCEATVTAEADSALWVELSWQHAEDIDLHLVRGTGDTFSSDDCYFANCRSGLAWGGPRVLDDPILDLDDISGTGPENINIPEPVADTYTVVVHDYDWGSANFGGANTATIKVYVDGILYLLDSRVLVGEDAEEAVAEIDLTGMMPVVTPL